MDVIKKLEELQNNEAFAQEIAMVNSPEELLSVLKNYGIELTMAEIEVLAAQASVQGEGELSDTDLDNVSGGAIGWWLKKIIPIIAGPLKMWR